MLVAKNVAIALLKIHYNIIYLEEIVACLISVIKYLTEGDLKTEIKS